MYAKPIVFRMLGLETLRIECHETCSSSATGFEILRGMGASKGIQRPVINQLDIKDKRLLFPLLLLLPVAEKTMEEVREGVEGHGDQRRKVIKSRQSANKVCHRDRIFPNVNRTKVGGIGGAGENVRDSLRSALVESSLAGSRKRMFGVCDDRWPIPQQFIWALCSDDPLYSFSMNGFPCTFV
jgi:hypothetical protein